ncbi:MAG: LysM peptidoglycan-binding domain-containing protein [Planctomycetes bacterium]|nr:LysM peptidoglycan-binding domain-containing protein [Planctomycetota bacterium]
MGQLEKYGLYVLCLVIFLILGVTIWGGGDAPPVRRTTATSGLNAIAPPGTGAAARPAPGGGTLDLKALLQPGPQPSTVAKPVDAPAVRGEPSSAPTQGGKVPPVGGNAGADATAEPPPATRPTYRVKQGDTFDSIAREQLGNAARRTEIARLNPGVRPERLAIGTVLVLPSAASPAPAPAPVAKADAARSDGAARTEASASRGGVVAYKVAKSDTFEGIASRQLGDRKRVAEIRELNPDVDPTRLRVGQEIRLPKQ